MTMQISNTIVFIFARQHFVDWKSEIFIGNKKKEFIISSLYWVLLTPSSEFVTHPLASHECAYTHFHLGGAHNIIP